MAARTVLVYTSLLLLGLILLTSGAAIEPSRSATNPISEAGESLIALRLTFVVISVGFFLAWAGERMWSPSETRRSHQASESESQK